MLFRSRCLDRYPHQWICCRCSWTSMVGGHCLRRIHRRCDCPSSCQKLCLHPCRTIRHRYWCWRILDACTTIQCRIGNCLRLQSDCFNINTDNPRLPQRFVALLWLFNNSLSRLASWFRTSSAMEPTTSVVEPKVSKEEPCTTLHG